jgi:translation factor GUF1, mitochondrial
VVTKIDLPTAQPIETALVMGTTFGFEPEDAIMTSAKQKIGIEEVIHSIIDNIPPPAPTLESAISKRHAEQVAALQELGQGESPSGAEATSDAGIVPDPDVDVNKAAERFMGRIVDSWFDEHRGVICLIQVLSGHLRENQRITCYASIKEAKADASVNDNRTEFGLQEIGVMTPKMARTGTLMGGQVGYVICGMRSTRQARVGDTMYLTTEWNAQGGATSGVSDMIPIEGYEQVKPMLFASIFPVNADEYEALVSAVDRLRLNDSSVTVIKDQSSTLGSGLRCGFLGFLHMVRTLPVQLWAYYRDSVFTICNRSYLFV